MKHTWKNLFWITLVLLVVSNLFWIYQVIDNAVGESYYKVSCDEYYKDMLSFKGMLDKKTKKEALRFLENNEVKYDTLTKGTDFILLFNSFDLQYDENGKLTEANLHCQQ